MQKGREPLTELSFREAYQYQPEPRPKYWKALRRELTCTKKTVTNLLPILGWLPKYKIKDNLLGDVISGMTVAVMHIPHGLAYSQLGGVPPVIGLYMAVFPVFMYVILGTSRHISLGTFAVLCAMVGDLVLKLTSGKDTTTEEVIRISSCVGLVVGLWQIALWLLRLGSLTVYFSNALVSGFTTGAAFHVLSYQFKNLLGIQMIRPSGPLKLIYLYINLFGRLDETNLVTLSISICFIIFLLSFYYGIKPLMQKKIPRCRIAIPIELITVAIGIIISYSMNLSEEYGVRIVESIPTGLPNPEVPETSVLPDLIIPSFPVAIVALSINLSLSKMFAKKDAYEISSQQEILAYGVANVFGSFFQCMPVAASLSRSAIQYTSGGKTQLASVFSIVIMILILFFMGPLFEPVPYCVLSSIVVATIVGLLLQIRDLPKLYRMSYLDGTVWLVTFLAVIIIDIDYGLLIGFIASTASLLALNHRPQLITLGQVPNNDLFLDLKHFKASDDIPNLLIVRVIGGMNFSNDSALQTTILRSAKAVEVNPQMSYGGAVILDFSSVSYVDPTAAKGLLFLSKDLHRIAFRLFLCGCNVAVYSNLERSHFFDEFPVNNVFATVSDAVLYATKIDLTVDDQE